MDADVHCTPRDHFGRTLKIVPLNGGYVGIFVGGPDGASRCTIAPEDREALAQAVLGDGYHITRRGDSSG